MNVRNLGEMGINLQKIIKRLMANDELIKLLYYTDKDPLSQEALTDEQKKTEVFEKLIKIVPYVSSVENAKSILVVKVDDGISNYYNQETQQISISVEVFVPLTQWIIKDTNLRPFKIMGEIMNSLKGKKINGLGLIDGGDFALTMLTKEMSTYTMRFSISQYD